MQENRASCYGPPCGNSTQEKNGNKLVMQTFYIINLGEWLWDRDIYTRLSYGCYSENRHPVEIKHIKSTRSQDKRRWRSPGGHLPGVKSLMIQVSAVLRILHFETSCFHHPATMQNHQKMAGLEQPVTRSMSLLINRLRPRVQVRKIRTMLIPKLIYTNSFFCYMIILE